MHVLLCNDDGILAPGLAAMYRALVDLGSVTVVAPDSMQSATAHGITVGQEIPVRRIHVQNAFYGWSVGGRAADLVDLEHCRLCFMEFKAEKIAKRSQSLSFTSRRVLFKPLITESPIRRLPIPTSEH